MAAALGLVIPALDEEACLPALLADLEGLRDAGAGIVVADGGSQDATPALARAWGAHVVRSAKGRATQLRAGAAACPPGCEVLVFLHADCRLPHATAARIAALGAQDGWGFFRPVLLGRSAWLPVVAGAMAWRSRLTGIATGDQGLYVSRALYERIGGFPEQPLMEDVEICRRLSRVRAPRAEPARLLSSGRRWDRDGALATIALMWWLRARYALGADPADLHRAYYGG